MIHGHNYHKEDKYLIVYEVGQIACRTYNDIENFKKEYVELLHRDDTKILGVYQNIENKGVINLLCE